MYTLADNLYQEMAKPILESLFIVNSLPADQPDVDALFVSHVTARRIIYPCKPYVESPLIDHIVDVAASFQDKACYISLLDQVVGYPNHCCIEISEFSLAYITSGTHHIENSLKMLLTGSYVIYACSGLWGIAVDSSGYGLFGGSQEFVEAVERAYPSLNLQVYEFLKYWREEYLYAFGVYSLSSVPQRWLLKLLKHVYGEESSHQMLQQMGML